MDEEGRWITEAIESATAATRAGVTILMIRMQDENDLADVVVTNATSAEMTAALLGYTGERLERNGNQ